MFKLPTIKVADLENKTVILRGDLDVPLIQTDQVWSIQETSRLEALIPTLKHLLGRNCKVIICGHLGRPEGIESKFSLKPTAEWFTQRFNLKIEEDDIGEFKGWKIGTNISLLENLRFYEGEEKNDEKFAQKLAELAEVYVNDAFASSHREHASVVGVPKFLPHFAGFQVEKEIAELSKVLDNPKRPLTVVIGGAKIETKLPLVSKMHGFADYVLVGGEIAEHTRELLKVEHEKTERRSKLLIADLTSDQKDITEDSLEMFLETINKSSTVVWNGPLGLILPENFENTSTKLARSLSENTNIYSIVGGGDTVELITRIGSRDKFSFVSTGGGAMLEFLSGEVLPGISALQN